MIFEVAGNTLQERLLAAIEQGYEERRQLFVKMAGSSEEKVAFWIADMPRVAFFITSNSVICPMDQPTCEIGGMGLVAGDYEVPVGTNEVDQFDPEWLRGSALLFYTRLKAELSEPLILGIERPDIGWYPPLPIWSITLRCCLSQDIVLSRAGRLFSSKC